MRIFTFSLIFLALLSCNKPVTELDAMSEGRVEAFGLQDVQLLESPFLNAFEKDQQWLFALSPDRLLHRFRLYAGLAPKAEVYGGWESRGISGHTLGHYLSALSMGYAASGEEEFLKRSQYIVTELAACQQAYGDGYVGGIPDQDKLFSEIKAGNIYSGGFDLNGAWVPWYTMHKLFAGLRHAYEYTGNEQAKAVLLRLADWCYNTVGHLSEEDFQKMLDCEYGGMNEEMAFLYEITQDERFLDLSLKFNHHRVLEPMMQEHDQLLGLHANTQIPKVLGLAKQYDITGEEKYKKGATFFWDAVVHQHSYANGGNSDHEHFGPAGTLKGQLSPYSSETCNTYNMLKLTDMMFQWEPSAALGDYYERALYNHILASQNSETGMVCYYMTHKAGEHKHFSSLDNDFWCCVGSGLENHMKYGAGIYYHRSETLYVNLFIASELHWEAKNARLKMLTSYPEKGGVELQYSSAIRQDFTMKIRIPTWYPTQPEVKINGQKIVQHIDKDGFLEISRTWENGDKVQLYFPMELRYEALAGDDNLKAVFYGPTLLAANFGTQEISSFDLPVFRMGTADDISIFSRKAADSLAFEVVQNGSDWTFSPYYALNDENYAIYNPILSDSEWDSYQTEKAAERARLIAMEEATIDQIRLGEMQPERDHHFEGHQTEAGGLANKWRHARDGGWFSFDLATAGKNEGLALMCQYWGGDSGNREFQILVNDQIIHTKALQAEKPGEYFYELYAIPPAIIIGDSVKVKFQALNNGIAGGLYDCRMVQQDTPNLNGWLQ
ncbi:glycoside hydrolase family 127 protein [Persicobacter diffluens]|uniref:Glycosyl hydrolase n=1 Tax=Persicobacter diffluens TaxID=981 RepID=A0AAN5APU6_9BACT|nr:glycosyl hydrolase [Persicobacter diffluens]